MESRWSAFDNWGNRLAILIMIVGLATGAFGWLTAHAHWTGPGNWAGAILMGFIFSLLLIFVTAVALFAWRFFRPLEKTEIEEVASSQAFSFVTADAFEARSEGINGGMKAIWEEINAINRRTAFLPNLGNTLGEAMESFQAALDSQIRRIEGTAEKASERVNSAHLELLHLLNFGINLTTRNVFQRLIAERPVANKLSPPIEEHERNKLSMELQLWLQSVRDISASAAFGADIMRIMRQAFYDGQQEVRRMDPTERPNGIDALPFADFYTVAYQCDETANCLSLFIKDLEDNDRQILSDLHGFYQTRSKP
jgi:hypothetical protein